MIGKNGILFLDLIIVKLEDVSTILVNGNKVTLTLKEGNSPASISKTFKDNKEATEVTKEIFDVIQNMIDSDAKGYDVETPELEDEETPEVETEETIPPQEQEVILEDTEEGTGEEEVIVEDEKEEEPKPKKSKQVKGAKIVK